MSSIVQPSSFASGRYEVRRFLGEGGKKRVFLAHDTRLDRDVAFALIKTEGLDDVGRERITREAQAMGRLGAHPHVVTIFEIGEEGGAPYVVTELMSGGDVEGLLEKAGGALSLATTLDFAKGVCRGLAFAHAQGVVHRDLKPGNVWLTSEGVAKIGDFGLAVALDRSRLTTHGLMVGTVAYMPPEQALGGEVTPQADLYSLGAMLYELVTGRPPFQSDDPTAVISQHINTPPVAPSWHSEHCPPDLEGLILHLLAKVPADRPASAQAVLEALDVVPRNVIQIEPMESVDGCLMAEGAVWTALIVEGEPGSECEAPVGGVAVGGGVRPLGEQRADEAFRLAVGAWPVGLGAQVTQALSCAGLGMQT
jgi:serine/threonine protein kinase